MSVSCKLIVGYLVADPKVYEVDLTCPDINKIGRLSWWAIKHGVIALVAAHPAVVQTIAGLELVLQ